MNVVLCQGVIGKFFQCMLARFFTNICEITEKRKFPFILAIKYLISLNVFIDALQEFYYPIS